MVTKRKNIPKPIEVKLMFSNRHTCCICMKLHKHVQIHHIDGNRNNNNINNLAVVCIDCHSIITGDEGLGRRYSNKEVKMYKLDWEARCKDLFAKFEKNKKETETEYSQPKSEFEYFTVLNSILFQTNNTCLYLLDVIPYCTDMNEVKNFSKQFHTIKGKLFDYYFQCAYLGSEILDEKFSKVNRAFNDAIRVAIRVHRIIQKGPNANELDLDKEYEEFDKLDKFIYDIIPDLKEEIISVMRILYGKRNLRNLNK